MSVLLYTLYYQFNSVPRRLYHFQLKRLRELATIVIESDNSATLPSNGNDAVASSGDASAASASVTTGSDGEMADLKQNIDQVRIRYTPS